MIINGQTVENVRVSYEPQKINVVFNAQRIQDITDAQEKTVIPSREAQIILPDEGYNALSRVIVEPIPKNYGLVTYTGGIITIT